MTFRELRRKLKDDGWMLVRQAGSHEQYEHPAKTGRVTVAGPDKRDVPIGTLNSIARQSGRYVK